MTTHHKTTTSGLDQSSFPMRLFQKAKKFGTWDPADLDFSQDRKDWLNFSADEQEILLQLTAVFLGGEESVTMDLLPLMMTMAKEGRLEDEIFLTSFLWEEAKHVEAFCRWIEEVPQDTSDLSRFYTPSYHKLFFDELPKAMGRLTTDQSPVAQALASVTYNMIVEGTLAETGYHAYLTVLEEHDLMPGMRQIVAHLNRDESRHIAYGVYLLSRLVAEHGDEVWEAIEEHMGNMLVVALGVVEEALGRYEVLPFGLHVDTFTDYAMSQFQKRFMRIAKARTQTTHELSTGDDFAVSPAAE